MNFKIFLFVRTSCPLIFLLTFLHSAVVPAQDAEDIAPAGEAAESAPSIEPYKPEPIIIRTGKDLINIRFTDESLENVINVFTKMLGVNIIAAPADLEGTVTVNLTGVEWKPTLSAILDMHDLMLIEKPSGSKLYSIIRKEPNEAEPMIVETLFLNHKKVSEVSSVVSSLLVTNASVLEFTSGNAIVVKTTQANLGEIKQVITKIDIPSKQICVETKFMELNDEASKQLGIDWQMLEGITLQAKDIGFDYSDTRSKATMDESGTIRTSRDGAQSTTDFHVKGDNVETVDVSSDGTITRTSVLPVDQREIRAAVLGVDDFKIVLSALNKMDGASIISSPKMIVASGNTNAYFSVGKRWPIKRQTRTHRGQDAGITDVVLELDTSIDTDYIKGGYLSTGIDLRVIPTVKTDDLIEARIKPKLIRRIANPYEEQEGGNFTAFWPTISVKEIDTTFTLQSSQTVAIGGLTSTKDSKKVSKIPLLGSIPLIGRLFSHTYEAQEQVETIIFVTLSLAKPESLRGKEGIPEEAELVHKKIIQSKTRKKKFDADLEKMKKATEGKSESSKK
ncbi:type II secretion system protein GspD [Verrucomicrobiota bacterium]